jgi:hypothetical protein
VDLIIACTFSGDYIYPPLSAKVQMELKAPQCADLRRAGQLHRLRDRPDGGVGPHAG